MNRLAAAVFSLLALQASSSHAAVFITAEQVGNDVVFSFDGTFDVQGLVESAVINSTVGVNPSGGALLFAGASLDPLAGYEMDDSLPSFGTTPALGTATGDTFKVLSGTDGTILAFADGYAGGSISGALTIADSTFVTLGLLTGQYRATASNLDFVQLDIPQEIPLPAGFVLLLSALGLFGLGGWWRQKQSAT